MKFPPLTNSVLSFVFVLGAATTPLFAQTETISQPAVGALTEESLGEALKSIGLKPVKTDKRYDFAFKTTIRGEEWKFSMSAVLSRNSETVWVMAWLDQIPSQSSDVPRTALLKLLAANDRLGNGKFFAYIPTNKRFVLQRVIKNQNMTTRTMMNALQDLAISVADEYPIWSVAQWSPAPTNPAAPTVRQPGSAAPAQAPRTAVGNQRTSEAQSKYSNSRIQ